jgi:hypothetical protein
MLLFTHASTVLVGFMSFLYYCIVLIHYCLCQIVINADSSTLGSLLG